MAEALGFENMSQTLLYKAHRIAMLDEQHADFPTCWGTIDLSNIDPETPAIVLEYIEWSIATWPKIENDTYTDEDALIEEQKFGNLIQSSDWWLESMDKIRIPIMIPCFQSKNEANWRLDLSRFTT